MVSTPVFVGLGLALIGYSGKDIFLLKKIFERYFFQDDILLDIANY